MTVVVLYLSAAVIFWIVCVRVIIREELSSDICIERCALLAGKSVVWPLGVFACLSNRAIKLIHAKVHG